MRRKIYDTNNETGVKSSDAGSEKAIKKLSVRIAEMENDLRVISNALPEQETEDSGTTGAANMDIRWHCKKCRYLLAFYDKQHDVMRTRYKEHIVYMRAGVGGFIQIVCRGCSEVNTQEYVQAESSEEPQD